MGTNQNQKFSGGTQDKGLNNFEPAIGAEISWTEDTQNVTGGVHRGVGPRYGVAPLAGHSNTETPAGTATNGIQRSEIQTGSVGLTYRKTIYGIVPITMTPYDGTYPKANRQYYVYLVGLDDSTNISIDACIGATLDSGVNKQESNFVAGLAQSSYRQESPLVRQHKTELLNLPQTTTPTAGNMQTILRQVGSRYWMPWAHISVPGKRIPYQWMLGKSTTTPDNTHAPSLSLWNIALTSGLAPTVYGGAPSESITNESPSNNRRLVQVYVLDADGYSLDAEYRLNIDNSNINAVRAYGTAATYNIAGVTASKIGASTAYSSMVNAVISDPGSFTNCRHDAILVAGETPFAIVYQDWLVAVKGMMPRWVDLTNPACIPRDSITFNNPGQQTSGFVSPNAPFGTGPATNTGVLRVNTNYEIGFSYYNKLLDYESNVVYGSAYTPGVDYQAVIVGITDATRPNLYEFMQFSTQSTVPWEFSETQAKANTEYPRAFHLNDYEYRFYYREAGSSEWLPAGSYDAAQLWFYWNWPASYGGSTPQGAIICAGPVAGLPGGQPNGFNDYSPLPKQRYVNVITYQNRAFWFAEKTMHFSLSNNVYAYPTRNSINLPVGFWLGGLVHTRTGEVTQQSRLLMFASNATYIAYFTGERLVQNVRVSSATVGQFEVDGSDFTADVLTDGTAFSARAAVIANGDAYWWGSQGVYYYNGVTKPDKISEILEPNIFDYVDMGRVSEVFAVYSKRTREVIWFYPPKETDATYPTHGLVYNIENGKFYPFKMRCQVDSAQNIKLESDNTPDGVDGERILLHCRETSSSTVQRTFYFDDLVKAGEQGPTRELTILSFTSPTTDTRRLNFAAGSVGVTAGGIAVNDLICIQNAKGYAPSLTLAPDIIAKITAVNNGSSYIDIELPPGAVWDASATLTGQTAFPIYQKKPTAAGLHGIVYAIDTNYWLPAGLSESWYWQYLYFLFKYSGIPSPISPFTSLSATANFLLTYRSLVGTGTTADILTLVNNSKGHCQLQHQLRPGQRDSQGQALAYTISGIHIGDPWTLEYLEAHCMAEQGFTLKEFEQ